VLLPFKNPELAVDHVTAHKYSFARWSRPVIRWLEPPSRRMTIGSSQWSPEPTGEWIWFTLSHRPAGYGTLLTGSGFGLGICHQLLSNLSYPPGTPIRATTPQLSALHTSQHHLLEAESSNAAPKQIPSPPPTLTLILACRSQAKAEEAREIILAQHDAELAARASRGEPVREGWREGLRVVWEGIDLDAVGGPKGVLQFCERLKRT
jgi:3-keto steroid reductase